MYSVIMGHLGTDAVAANSIANIAKNIIASLALGIGNGGSIMVGNELGAGNLERARVMGRKLCRISILSGVGSGIFLLPPPTDHDAYRPFPSGPGLPLVNAFHVRRLYGGPVH